MTVEIICVGTEILLGNIVNTNAAFLAEQCAGLGLTNYYQSVVGDNENRLTEAIQTAMKRSDIIILSGGLGPTEDDLTKEVAAKVCKLPLEENGEARARIKEFFKKRGKTPTENNWKQALVPQGAIAVQNDNGTAPGIIIEGKENRLILLPGPPEELRSMFLQDIAPYLAKLTNEALFSKTVKIVGVGESKAETMIADLIDGQTNPTIATYAKLGEVHIRVTASGPNAKEAKKLVKPMVKELKDRFGSAVYATEDSVTLEQSVADLLVGNRLTIGCAESCTGGLLSGRIINVPGVSEVYKCGMITYSNKAKRKLLGVKKGTLQKYGAVSSKVAEEMVKGLANLAKVDVALSVTGIAGPDGGTEEKPVGTVFIACFVKGKTVVKEYHFSGNRQIIRNATVTAALVLARECIQEYLSKVLMGS